MSRGYYGGDYPNYHQSHWDYPSYSSYGDPHQPRARPRSRERTRFEPQLEQDTLAEEQALREFIEQTDSKWDETNPDYKRDYAVVDKWDAYVGAVIIPFQAAFLPQGEGATKHQLKKWMDEAKSMSGEVFKMIDDERKQAEERSRGHFSPENSTPEPEPEPEPKPERAAAEDGINWGLPRAREQRPDAYPSLHRDTAREEIPKPRRARPASQSRSQSSSRPKPSGHPFEDGVVEKILKVHVELFGVYENIKAHSPESSDILSNAIKIVDQSRKLFQGLSPGEQSQATQSLTVERALDQLIDAPSRLTRKIHSPRPFLELERDAVHLKDALGAFQTVRTQRRPERPERPEESHHSQPRARASDEHRAGDQLKERIAQLVRSADGLVSSTSSWDARAQTLCGSISRALHDTYNITLGARSDRLERLGKKDKVWEDCDKLDSLLVLRELTHHDMAKMVALAENIRRKFDEYFPPPAHEQPPPRRASTFPQSATEFDSSRYPPPSGTRSGHRRRRSSTTSSKGLHTFFFGR